MSTRLRLRRADGQVYLDRWGFQFPKGDRPFFGAFLHKMEAPDPGIDLHDHPWSFVSLILWGGYTEARASSREACSHAERAEKRGDRLRGYPVTRRPLTVRSMRLDECHSITELARTTSWSLVFHGLKRRQWGFYLPTGWMYWKDYERTVRAERRDMWAEISNVEEERINIPGEAA